MRSNRKIGPIRTIFHSARPRAEHVGIQNFNKISVKLRLIGLNTSIPEGQIDRQV